MEQSWTRNIKKSVHHEQFLHLSQCFPKPSTAQVPGSVDMWVKVKRVTVCFAIIKRTELKCIHE